MITGIYRLCFPNTNKSYIGQSIDIKLRYRIHKTTLKANKASKKLQEAYIAYGMPSLEILIECDTSELNDMEVQAMQVFNSIEDGFNTIDGCTHRSELRGELAGNAKYSNDQIEEVFMYLTDNSLTHSEIIEITGISRGTVADISDGKSHKWLYDKYPELYTKLIGLKGYNRKSNKHTAKNQGKVYPEVISPEGQVFEVSSLRGFCRTHGLNHGGFGEMLRGHRTNHKGWKVLK